MEKDGGGGRGGRGGEGRGRRREGDGKWIELKDAKVEEREKQWEALTNSVEWSVEGWGEGVRGRSVP